MRALYELMFDLRPNLWTSKQDIYELIAANQEDDERLDWFGDFTGIHKKKAATKTGMALNAFRNRVLSAITMQIDSSNTNSGRNQLRFVKQDQYC